MQLQVGQSVSASHCRCAEAAESIAAALDARLQALPQHQQGAGEEAAAAFAPTATEALILGRVALGMAGRSALLPLVLGPPDQWRAAVRDSSSSTGAVARRALLGSRSSMGSLTGAGGVAAPAPSPRYEQLQQRLHSVGLQAYSTWADWAAAGLTAALTAGLAADQTLTADVPLRSWDETVIGGGGGTGADGGAEVEMRFQLPAAPSPSAIQLALAACQEVDRAGGWVGRVNAAGG